MAGISVRRESGGEERGGKEGCELVRITNYG